ncbi:hypothetical protein C5S35_03780, partial [Candidatus Methanophagaceae archaeon]
LLFEHKMFADAISAAHYSMLDELK